MEENKNIEQQLTNALDNSNSKQVENIIEKNPTETSKILPENSPLQNEAKEVTDGDKRTDRVDNEVIKDSIDDYHTPGGFLNQNQNGMLKDEAVDDAFFENFVKQMRAENDKVIDEYRATHPDDINYPALQDWADSIKDDDDSTTRAVAYSLDDVKDKKDLDSYKWAQQNDYDEAQAKLDEASDTMKKAREGDEFNNEYRKAAGQKAFPAGAARARAQKNMNVANALQNTEMDDATFAAALKDKQLIRDLKGMPIEQDRLDRIGMFIDNYRAAAANKDTEKAEQLIEENPDIAVEVLPEGTNAHEEAAQILDGDARTDEVNNERLSEDFENVDDLYNYLIDWDKVNVYGPEENHSEWENEPDFDTSYWDASMGENPLPEGERPNFHEGDEAIDRMQERMAHDEDFAGPDELPATYEQIVEPGKELALTSGNEIMSAEEPMEVEYRIIDEEVDNDDTIPEEEKEAEKQRRKQRLRENALEETPEIIGGNVSATTSAPGKGTEIKEERRGPGSSFGNSFKASMPSGSYSAPNVKGDKPGKKEAKDIKSKAGGGTLPPTNEGGAISVNARNANSSNGSVTSNGFISSGATNKTGSSLSVKPVKLPNGEVHTQDYSGGVASGDIEKLSGLAKAHIDNIETRIRELPEGIAEAWGFGIKYKHVEYNGTQLDQCTPNQLNEIEKILSRLGV